MQSLHVPALVGTPGKPAFELACCKRRSFQYMHCNANAQGRPRNVSQCYCAREWVRKKTEPSINDATLNDD